MKTDPWLGITLVLGSEKAALSALTLRAARVLMVPVGLTLYAGQ